MYQTIKERGILKASIVFLVAAMIMSTIMVIPSKATTVYTSKAAAAKAIQNKIIAGNNSFTIYVSSSSYVPSTSNVLHAAISNGKVTTVYSEPATHRSDVLREAYVKSITITSSYNSTQKAYAVKTTATCYVSAAKRKAINTKVASYVSSTSGSTDYAIAKSALKAICSDLKYDSGAKPSKSDAHIYTAVDTGKAVCSDYALLYYLTLKAKGINCRYIWGTADGTTHAWNIVKVDGKWYNVDPTWADSSFSANFLKGSSDSTFKKHHTRNSLYTTTAFNNSYPMSSSNY